jgi:hypothetical protein
VPNEALVSTIKNIMSVAKSGDVDAANKLYGELFSSPEFASYSPGDQRQALKLLVHAKRTGPRPASSVETHRAAMAPLAVLAETHGDPADYEMLGLCQLVVGDIEAAAVSARAGLAIERAKSPESDLCGRLMKLLSAT